MAFTPSMVPNGDSKETAKADGRRAEGRAKRACGRHHGRMLVVAAGKQAATIALATNFKGLPQMVGGIPVGPRLARLRWGPPTKRQVISAKPTSGTSSTR